MNKNDLKIFVLILLALAKGAVEVTLNSQGEVLSGSTQLLWGLIFLLVTIVWAMTDSDTHEFEKPFDFGFLMYTFWPVALPYYLISTRGTEGLVFFIGLVGIWLGPWLAGVVAYGYVYAAWQS